MFDKLRDSSKLLKVRGTRTGFEIPIPDEIIEQWKKCWTPMRSGLVSLFSRPIECNARSRDMFLDAFINPNDSGHLDFFFTYRYNRIPRKDISLVKEVLEGDPRVRDLYNWADFELLFEMIEKHNEPINDPLYENVE